MNFRWDLVILDPILLVLGISILSFIVIRQRTSLKWVLYFISTLTFWLITTIILKINILTINKSILTSNFSSPFLLILILLGLTMLLMLILSPLANYLTNKLHSRKWYVFLGLINLVFGLIFTVANTNFNLIILYVLTGLNLIIALSTFSLFFLTFNEQFYYRIAPVLSVAIIGIVISFAIFLGNFIVEIDYSLLKLPNNYLIFSLIICLLAIAGFICSIVFLGNENKIYVNNFELSQSKKLPKFQTYRLVYLSVMMFLLGVFFGFSQSSLVQQYLTSLFYVQTSLTLQEIEVWISTYQQFFVVGEFIFGYFIYKYIISKFGFKPLVLTSFGLTALTFLIVVFANNPYVYVFFNFFIGLAFSQIFYAFFSMSLVWTYRVKLVPVSGISLAGLTTGALIVQIIISSLEFNKIGLFQFNYLQEPFDFEKLASQIVIICYGVIGAFCIFSLVVLFFTMKYVFADYLFINKAQQYAKIILKEQQKQKSQNRILIDEIKVIE